MKYIFMMLILLIILVIPSNAQNNTKLLQYNDSSSRVTYELEQNFTEGVWINFLQRIYTYPAGKVWNTPDDILGDTPSELIEQFWIKKGETYIWDDMGRILWEVDEQAQTITSIHQVREGEEWRDWKREVVNFVIDTNGDKQFSEVIVQRIENNELINHSRTIYTRAPDGTLLYEKVEQLWNGTDWENSIREIYIYTNQLDTILYERWENGNWVDYERNIMGYPGLKLGNYQFFENKSSMLVQQWIDNSWQDVQLYSYTYNNDGDLIEELLQAGYGIEWLNTSLTQYAYNGNTVGKLTNINSESRLTHKLIKYWDYSTNEWNISKQIFTSYEDIKMSSENDKEVIGNFRLYQNYPNPFNPSTNISFELLEESNVKILIYDISGRSINELVNKKMTAGNKTIIWDGLDKTGNPVSGGVYFYRIQVEDLSISRKMVLLK